MTLSVLMYAMMMATFVALAGVLVFDAVSAVLRWSAARAARAARSGAAAPRGSSASGARGARVAPTIL